MEQRDFILKEIEKISVLILGLIGKLKRIQSKKLFEEEKEVLFGEMEEISGITIDMMLEADHNEIDKLFPKEQGYDFRNMELMADLLYEFSQLMNDEERIKALSKAINLLELVDREGKIFSFERQEKLAFYRSQI